MSKIKVAYVVNDLLVGGAQSVVYNLCKNIDQEKFAVKVYYLYNYEKVKTTMLDQFTEAGIETECLSDLSSGVSFSRLIWRCAKKFKFDQPDIVHVHLPNSVLVGGMAAILNNKKLIVHEHNTHGFYSWKIKLMFGLVRCFSKLTICYAETVEKELFHSNHLVLKPEDFFGQKVITVLNGVDLAVIQGVVEAFRLNSDLLIKKRDDLGLVVGDIVVIAVARLVKWKGHLNLIKAFAQAVKYNDKLKLLIVGEGPDQKILQAEIERLDLSSSAQLVGARNDVAELLTMSDIFSLVLDYDDGVDAEAIGVAGFEAMAAGLPVIIGGYTGADFYVENNKSGVIVKPHDVSDLGQAIVALAASKDKRLEIGQQALSRVKTFEARVIIKIYQYIYTIL